jgi:hypothetical protein
MSDKVEVLKTLQREHQVAEELAERIRELGVRLKEGEPIPPRTLRMGVGLLDAYLHRVHTLQFDRELWAEAQRFTDPDCLGVLDATREDHLQMRRSARALLERISHWTPGDRVADWGIAQDLIRLASADENVNRFEEQQPFVCLRSTLPEAVRGRLGEQLEGHRGTKGALERNIARFLRASLRPACPLGPPS